MRKFYLIITILCMMMVSCNEVGDDGTIQGHEYVDLGLPSGLKWANCNVGAERSEDYGQYFAWGETSPKTTYNTENCLTFEKEMEDISGDAQYDAATANWGDKWRMPTNKECQELIDYCKWESITHNGVEGRKVTGPNGNSIFLPAAGYREGLLHCNPGDYGYYWSSTPNNGDNVNGAYNLYFYGKYRNVLNVNRSPGHSIRPVTE